MAEPVCQDIVSPAELLLGVVEALFDVEDVAFVGLGLVAVDLGLAIGQVLLVFSQLQGLGGAAFLAD